MAIYTYLRCSLLLFLPSVLAQEWDAEGGSAQRVGLATLKGVDTSSAARHTLFSYPLTSGVTGQLNAAPLVTALGSVVVVTQNCTAVLLPDPSNQKVGSPWTPDAVWEPASGANPPSPGGSVLMNGATLFMVDAANMALHAASVSKNHFKPLRWSPLVFDFSGFASIQSDASLLPMPATGQLWVPLQSTLTGNAGVAAVVDISDGTYTVVPQPTAGSRCVQSQDAGSSAAAGGGVALLGSYKCGLAVFSPGTGSGGPGPAVQYTSEPGTQFMFNYGQARSHPVYDSPSSRLFFLDWGVSMESPQHVCCLQGAKGGGGGTTYTPCSGWPAAPLTIPGCTPLPAINTTGSGTPSGQVWYSRWEWMGLALWGGAGKGAGRLFIAASGAVNNNIVPSNATQLISTLFTIDTGTGAVVDQVRFNSDRLNSAPLVVGSNVRKSPTRLYVTGTMGRVYCFDPTALAAGPVWTSPDLPGVPHGYLSQAAYSYLAATQRGTLLVTGIGRGAGWAGNGTAYAIAHGFQPPLGADE